MPDCPCANLPGCLKISTWICWNWKEKCFRPSKSWEFLHRVETQSFKMILLETGSDTWICLGTSAPISILHIFQGSPRIRGDLTQSYLFYRTTLCLTGRDSLQISGWMITLKYVKMGQGVHQKIVTDLMEKLCVIENSKFRFLLDLVYFRKSGSILLRETYRFAKNLWPQHRNV